MLVDGAGKELTSAGIVKSRGNDLVFKWLHSKESMNSGSFNLFIAQAKGPDCL